MRSFVLFGFFPFPLDFSQRRPRLSSVAAAPMSVRNLSSLSLSLRRWGSSQPRGAETDTITRTPPLPGTVDL